MDPRFRIDMDAVRRFLRDKEAARRQDLAEKLEAAQADFRRIVDRISTKYRPRRIYQWGSLVETAHFSEISDIDIAL